MSLRFTPQTARPLPRAHLPLIGREADLMLASRLLSTPTVRLLTLRGPGGIGKTRMATELANLLAQEFDLGAVWVDLAPLREAAQMVSAIAAALGTASSSVSDLAEDLGQYSLLLILDNFEHLPQAAPDLAELLARSANLRVLVTSRAALHLRSEHQLPVGPLGLPRKEASEECASVRMFLECAEAVDPRFHFDSSHRALVERICIRLEGVPLALELAAAHLQSLTLSGLLSWLDRPLDVLTDGPSDGPHHGASLRSTIDWSFSLLSEQERRVFAACGAFTGGFTLPALEAVVEEPCTREALIRLADHSLVYAVDGPEPRWSMLEPIREYAQERLNDLPLAPQLLDRHAQFFLTLAVAAGDLEQPEWHDRLRIEAANLHSSLEWFVDRRQVPEAMRLVTTSAMNPGRSASRLEYASLKRVLALPGVIEEPALFARTLLSLGSACIHLNLFEEALDVDRAAAVQFAELGDPQGEMDALLSLATVHPGLGDYQAALELFGRLERPLGISHDLPRLITVVNNTGVAYLCLNQPAQANIYFERMQTLSEELEFDRGAVYGLTLRSWATYRQGQTVAALPLAREAWRRSLPLPDHFLKFVLLHQLAFQVRDSGDLSLAARMVGCSDAMRTSSGEPWDVCFAPDVRNLDASLHEAMGQTYAEERAAGGGRTLEELTPEVQAWLDGQPHPPTAVPAELPLTVRELDVLSLLIQGTSDKKISQHLNISSTTVSKHVSNMLGKLGLHNRVELTRWATGHPQTSQLR